MAHVEATRKSVFSVSNLLEATRASRFTYGSLRTERHSVFDYIVEVQATRLNVWVVRPLRFSAIFPESRPV